MSYKAANFIFFFPRNIPKFFVCVLILGMESFKMPLDFLYYRWFKSTNEQSYFAWVGFMPEAQKVPVSTILLTHFRPLFLLLSNLEFYLKESSLSCHA